MTDKYHLSKGAHDTAEEGRCAMEWVSYLAGEPHSSSPRCVSPVLTCFCVSFNDGLPDDQRQRLRPFLARTIGTRGDGMDEARAWMATDWLVRTYAPAWLSLAGLDESALRLRGLPPVLSVEGLSRAMADLDVARSEAAAARAAGWAAGAAAVWAAGAAAGGNAARGAARGAAWDAGTAAAMVAGGNAGGVAAMAAGEAAAMAAAITAMDAALAAGGNAASAFQPTVEALRESAFGLLDRMLPAEVIQLPVVEDAAMVCTFAGTR